MAVQDGPRRDNRFLMWTGHHSIRLMIPAAVLIIGFDVAGRPGGVNGWLSWVVSAVWFAWFATMMIDYNYHEERLCERCITATPLDPQKAVTKWDRLLRLQHAKRIFLLLSAGVILWFFGGSLFKTDRHWWGEVINVASILVIVLIMTNLHIHRRLYPWCPYCRWGDGGEPEVVPDPDPAESVS